MFKFIDEIKLAAKQKRHSPYWPISAYENPSFSKTLNRLIIAYTIFAVALNYCAALVSTTDFISEGFGEAAKFLGKWPSIYGRYQDLVLYDPTSGSQYLSIAFVSFSAAILFGFFLAYVYFMKVLLPNDYLECDRRASYGFLSILSFVIVGIWITFFHSMDFVGPKYLGTKIFFLWPLFPLIAGLASTVASVGVLLVLGSVLKLAHQRVR